MQPGESHRCWPRQVAAKYIGMKALGRHAVSQCVSKKSRHNSCKIQNWTWVQFEHEVLLLNTRIKSTSTLDHLNRSCKLRPL